MLKSPVCYLLLQILFFLIILVSLFGTNGTITPEEPDHDHDEALDSWVVKEDRRVLASTDSGQVSAVNLTDGYGRRYHLQFITLEPASLFLPVLLQADLYFYVHTGRGTLGWLCETGDMQRLDVEPGDIYQLESGSIFYVRSHPDPMRAKLRIFAFFTTRKDENSFSSDNVAGLAYSRLSDLVFGFDRGVLQLAFKIPEESIEELVRAGKSPMIVPAVTKMKNEMEYFRRPLKDEDNNKKTRTFNILKTKPDVRNANGWSVAVNHKVFGALKSSDVGFFLVNLNKGAMMGPHWNPRATEIAIVTHGQGIVHVVCSREVSDSGCKDSRLRVSEGDVFVVPRYHPMAQLAFNNDTLVFMGFSTLARNNRPQFLAGKSSVLRTLDGGILAMSFNVSNITWSRFVASQADSIILDCTSCAEEEERRMEEETHKRRQEEEEEERRRQQKEETRRRQQEEEKARRKEEEKKRKIEEARRRQEEEEQKKREEEAAARRREEEEMRRQEKERREEEEKEQEERREEQEAKRRKEEEERRREEKEERREEEEAKKREEEEEKREEEEAKRREEEETRKEARRREETEMRTEEEEEEERASRRQKEEEKRREKEEQERTRRKQEQEEQRRQEEEARKQEEEEARRREEQKRREKEEEEQRRQEKEEARQRQEEEEEIRRVEEKQKRQEEEEEEARYHDGQEARR